MSKPTYRRNFIDRRLFLDTNILLDAVCKERPECQEARRVLQRCNGGGDMAFAASVSFKDVYYVLTKRYGRNAALGALKYLMDLVIIAPISAEDCEMSYRSDEPDFEDGLVRACAELNDADFILTRDADAYKYSSVRSVTCSEYLHIAEARDENIRAKLAYGQ